jgi:hypothetical protein
MVRVNHRNKSALTPWQPFVGAGMSSGNLNNEDCFSDQPKRLLERFLESFVTALR